MLSTQTIGDFLEHDLLIAVHCNARGCSRYVKIDLEALGKRIGYDTDVYVDSFRRRFKCSKCGSRDVDFKISSKAASAFSKYPDFFKKDAT